MGRLRREVKAAELDNHARGRKQLFGGRTTAEEVHAKLAFPKNAKCGGCKRRPVIRAITMAPFDEARKRYPEIDLIAEMNPNELMHRIVRIRENLTDKEGKPYIRLGIAYSCKSCAPVMEKALARAPSWCIVEINRGPGAEKPIVGVI